MLHNLSHHGKDIERRLISRIGSLGPELEPENQRIVSSRARGGISNRFEVAVVANPSATGTEGSLSVVRAGIWLRERTTEMGHFRPFAAWSATGCRAPIADARKAVWLANLTPVADLRRDEDITVSAEANHERAE